MGLLEGKHATLEIDALIDKGGWKSVPLGCGWPRVVGCQTSFSDDS